MKHARQVVFGGGSQVSVCLCSTTSLRMYVPLGDRFSWLQRFHSINQTPIKDSSLQHMFLVFSSSHLLTQPEPWLDEVTYFTSEPVTQAGRSRFCIFYIQQLITQAILKIEKQNKLHCHLHTLIVCLLEPHLLHLSGTLIGVFLSGQACKTGSMFSSSSFGCSSTTGL
jgi:hypothetical protein